MAANAAEFSRSHPDESPGYQAVLSDLDKKLAQAKEALAGQRSGILGVRAGSAIKLELRSTMRQAHLAHIAQVARAAGREAPQVPHEFVFKPGTRTHVAFQTTARGFLTRAEAHRELLVRHGLVESVLTELRQSLDQFDAAIVSSGEARTAHVRASERAPAAGGRSVSGRQSAGQVQPGAVPGHAGGVGGVAEHQQCGR